MANATFELEGASELLELLKKFESDFGSRDSNKILVGAARASLRPVLRQARKIAPEDTGELRRSLIVTARRTRSYDRKNKYYRGESIVGLVTTAPGRKIVAKRISILKRQAKKQGRTLSNAEEVAAGKVRFGARAIVTEVGSEVRNQQPRHWLERSFGGNITNITSTLKEEILGRIVKYRSKKH